MTPKIFSKTEFSGFTLMEVLMAVLLTGIVAAVGISQFIDFSSEAKTNVTTEKLIELKYAITGDPRLVSNGQHTRPGYEVHCQGLPSTLTDLVTQPGSGTCSSTYSPYTKIGWRGPYVSNTDSNWNRDAWGTTIIYSSGSRYVRSGGANATDDGGTGDDITVSF